MPAPIAEEQIEKFTEAFLETEGYELVDFRIIGSASRPVIEVYCDIEGGITAEECGNLARSLKHRLAVEGYFDDNTTLVVSSPGLDRVIRKEKDFFRFAGRRVVVALAEPIAGRGKVRGVLQGYQDGTLILSDTEEGDLALASGRWKEVRLVPEYPESFR